MNSTVSNASFEKELSKAASAQSAVLVDALSALAERIKAGDAFAFDIFYDTSKNYVYNNIRGLSSSITDETAQDIMQEVYIKAFSNISSLNDPKGTLKWLKTITMNTTRDYLRKRNVRYESLIKEDEETSFENAVSESELMEPIEIPENIVEDSATRKIVADALMALPERQRMLMSEFYYNGKSVKDIAAETGMSESAVKTQLSRTRASLKNTFLKMEKEQGIRLHSAGIIPFIFFMFYLLTKDRTITQAAGSAVKSAVFDSAAVKSAIAAAAKAAGKAASGLSQPAAGQALKGSAEGASDMASEIAQQAGGIDSSAGTANSAMDTGSSSAKAAGAAAKTGGLSAAAKGIIIGAAAAVAIGVAAATAVVVKNNNETEIIAEAESETATEETTAEATAEVTEETTQEVDETTLMYRAYYDKIIELEEEYGEKEFISLENEISEGLYNPKAYYSGVCYAELIDFDGDGTEEMIIGYYDDSSSGVSDYTVEIWGYEDGTAVKILSENAFSDTGDYSRIVLACKDGIYYICFGVHIGQDYYGEYEWYTVKDNEAVLAEYIKMYTGYDEYDEYYEDEDHGDSNYIDDTEVTFQEAEEAYESWNEYLIYKRFMEYNSYEVYYEYELVEIEEDLQGTFDNSVYSYEYTMTGPKLDETLAFLAGYLE